MKAFVVGCLLTMLSVACGNNDHKAAQNDSLTAGNLNVAIMEQIDSVLSRTAVPSRLSAWVPSRPEFNLADGFKPFPKSLEDQPVPFLIDKIVPEGHYKYWECVFSEVLNPFDPHPGRRRVVVYNGDIDYAPIAHTISSKYGFFFGCRPLGCSSYIVGVKDGNEVDLIDSEQKLLAFSDI